MQCAYTGSSCISGVVTQPLLLAEVPLLDDRDFLYREVTQQLPGGIHIIFGQSLTAAEEAACPDVPHPKGVIRGEMGASGGCPWTPLDSSSCLLPCPVAHDTYCWKKIWMVVAGSCMSMSGNRGTVLPAV